MSSKEFPQKPKTIEVNKIDPNDPEFEEIMKEAEKGIDSNNLKPLPESIKKKLEELRKTKEQKGIDSQEKDIEIGRIHKFVQEQDEKLFELLMDSFRKKENSEAIVSDLKRDYEIYVETRDRVYQEKGAKTSPSEIYSLLPGNLFVSASLEYAKNILKDELD